jgi:phosphatidylserine/phosphatidylglycerophosphate/cardiolipin synthase-like enzyme
VRFKNENNTLKAYAVAGTQTVLLALDIDQSKVLNEEFMGFKITRRQAGKAPILLNGSKRFPKDDAQHPQQPLSPIQSYMWKDYTADPGTTYTYKFEAMFGNWDDLKPKFQTELKVTTETLNEGEHSVYFNFGVTGCQAYAKAFPKKKIDKLPPKSREKAFKILGRELYEDGLLAFLAQAKDHNFSLLCAFYELEYEPFLQELKKAANRCGDVRIIYNGKKEQGTKNESALKKAGLISKSKARTNQVAQPHNKFMVLLESGTPTEVWTGSTNITIRGIFGHCNTGHWVRKPAIAAKYHKYWKALWDNPLKKDIRAVTDSLQKDISGKNVGAGTKVVFSPRKSDAMLQSYINMMDDADTAVCIIFPFNIEKIFKDFYTVDKKYIRFIITDKKGDKTNFVTNDRDVYRTCGAILDSPIEKWVEKTTKAANWVTEITTKATTQASTLYVHNKFFIVDPLGGSPVVVTGSANFSDESLKNNDENMLIIKGNKRVADIYFTEFERLFDHFLPRYLQELGKSTEGFSKPLDDQYVWFNKYYNPELLARKRKSMFVNMVV